MNPRMSSLWLPVEPAIRKIKHKIDIPQLEGEQGVFAVDITGNGVYLRALVRFLRSPLGAHVEGVFVDFMSLFQRPRDRAQEAAFGAALGVMAQLYASATGTIVAQGTQAFVVHFAPQEVDDYVYKLECSMPSVVHAAADSADGAAEGTEAAAGSEDGKGTTAPLEIILRGRAVRPVCHFELESSTYLQRRPADTRAVVLYVAGVWQARRGAGGSALLPGPACSRLDPLPGAP